jgi:hypothetical protein
MRANEFLSELFNPKKARPFKWTSLTSARSHLSDGRYLIVNFIPLDKENMNAAPIAIEFSVGDDFEVTGGGNVSEIFATVIEVIKYFLKGFHSTPALYFTADEQSRAKMYDTLAKRVAHQVGWHVVPYDEMIADPKYKTALSFGDFMFAIEPGHAPEHRVHAQKPQHGEFMPIYYVVSMDNDDLPAIKIKAKKGLQAMDWVQANIPEFKDEDHMAMNAYRVPPKDKKIIDAGSIR